MNHPNLNTEIVHGVGQCPACKQRVHVVGDRQRHRARWVCTQCQTVGTMPLILDGYPASIPGAFMPASA